MAAFMVSIPDDKHEKLKKLAQARGISLNKLIEELSTIALTEFEAETKFRAMVAKGNPERGIAILDKLDTYFGDRLKNNE